MKRKVKICKNQQCGNRVNKPDAAVCIGCGASFRGISWKILSEEEIEKALQPEVIEEEPEISKRGEETPAEEPKTPEKLVIICPNCGARVPYHIGIENCSECGEYIQEEIPVKENETLEKETQNGGENLNFAKGMRSLDGVCYLEFTGETMEIGRHALGQSYFEGHGKGKVSRQHAKIQKKEDGWHIVYYRREDRTYRDGILNAIYINDRMLQLDESYRLQPGDRISFAEMDMTDPLAAFFRVE